MHRANHSEAYICSHVGYISVPSRLETCPGQRAQQFRSRLETCPGQSGRQPQQAVSLLRAVYSEIQQESQLLELPRADCPTPSTL